MDDNILDELLLQLGGSVISKVHNNDNGEECITLYISILSYAPIAAFQEWEKLLKERGDTRTLTGMSVVITDKGEFNYTPLFTDICRSCDKAGVCENCSRGRVC